MLNLRSLRLFIAVAERSSISKAATAMHISQSALSRQIQNLERDLGVRLFERVGKRLVLTAEGEDLLPRMDALLQQTFHLSDRIQQHRSQESGYLRLGATPQTIESVLAPVLRSWRSKNSAVEVHLVEGRNERLLEDVENGIVHAAIAWAPSEQKLERQDLFKARLYVVLPPEHPCSAETSVELSEISQDTILTLRRGFMTRHMLDKACGKAGLRLHKTIESVSTQTLWALAVSGMGVAVVSSTAVSQWDESQIKLLTLDGQTLEETVSMVFHTERFRPMILRDFQSELQLFLSDSIDGVRFRRCATSLM